ncbi:MAG TPA: carboxymuconolactone decarboxylase family protein [Terriglobales bacterium]|nr:carboxymuconolactone decarboxylase family protein [Terriglobales bacterium]
MHGDEEAPEQRLDYAAAAPQGLQALLGLQAYVNNHTGLDHKLVELVKLRCSQINGCAYCVDMHARDARKAGESNQRLDAVAVWRESTFFTPSERAGLAWAEAVTLVSQDHVPDDVFEWVGKYFSGKALVDLTYAVIAINAWNRLAIGFRVPAAGAPAR